MKTKITKDNKGKKMRWWKNKRKKKRDPDDGLKWFITRWDQVPIIKDPILGQRSLASATTNIIRYSTLWFRDDTKKRRKQLRCVRFNKNRRA